MAKILASIEAGTRRARVPVQKPSAVVSHKNVSGSIFGPQGDRRASGSIAKQAASPNKAVLYRHLVSLYRADPMERVAMVKSGVPAADFVVLAANLCMPKERLASTLGLARATVDRKVRDNKLLSTDESSRMLGMASLIGQVQSMVAESGQVQGFDAGVWVSHWLEQPVPALGGRRPAEFMDTPEGQGIVSRLVAQMQSGAYA